MVLQIGDGGVGSDEPRQAGKSGGEALASPFTLFASFSVVRVAQTLVIVRRETPAVSIQTA